MNMTSMFKYLPYNMASACVCASCVIETKPATLRAARFFDVRIKTRIRFALQDGEF